MGTGPLSYEVPGGTVTFFGWTEEEAQKIIIQYKTQKEGKKMSQRIRLVVDFPVDPSTASQRSMEAIAEEMRQYTSVVLIKDKEIQLESLSEVVSVHTHDSTSSYACEDCIRLAEDERNGNT